MLTIFKIIKDSLIIFGGMVIGEHWGNPRYLLIGLLLFLIGLTLSFIIHSHQKKHTQ